MASPDVKFPPTMTTEQINNHALTNPTMMMSIPEITRPFLQGITAPTEEEWEMLFEDAKRSNAKQVIASNPGISYSTFCSRMARWDKGERGPATKAISARGRRGRPRSSTGSRTPGSKRKRVSSDDEEDDEDGSGSDAEFSRRRRSTNAAGAQQLLEHSTRSAFHPFGALGSSPFAMGSSLTSPTTKPSVLTCLTEVEAQLCNEIKSAAKAMRETGGWLSQSNQMIDQLESKEIAIVKEEIAAARAAVESVRKLRGGETS